MTNTKPSPGTIKRCTSCDQPASATVIFGVHRYLRKDGFVYHEKLTCKTCEAAHTKEYWDAHKDKKAEIKQRYKDAHQNTIEYHVQEKIATWRKASSVPSDLTVDYLVWLYLQQGGLCYYTGEPMLYGWVDGKVHDNSLSLDKLDPSLGYVKSNVVWCTYLANTMKQGKSEPDFYRFIEKILTYKLGAPMAQNISIKEQLQNASRKARLGTLPNIVFEECLVSANKGKNSHSIYFAETKSARFLLSEAIGAAYKEEWDKKRCGLGGDDPFVIKIIEELAAETGLSLTMVPQNDSRYVPFPPLSQPFLIVEVSW